VNEDLSHAAIAQVATQRECFDEVLLSGLQATSISARQYRGRAA
jgi:hypothetical protein